MANTPDNCSINLNIDDQNLSQACFEEDVTQERSLQARLASVTRKKNEIIPLLSDVAANREVIKVHFDIYLARIEALYSACVPSHSEWLNKHKSSFDHFQSRVHNALFPPQSRKTPRERDISPFRPPIETAVTPTKPPSVTSSTSSRQSRASEAARIKLAEQRAKIRSQSEALERKYKVEEEEMKIKLKHEEEMMQLKHMKDKIIQEEREREMNLFEKELDELGIGSPIKKENYSYENEDNQSKVITKMMNTFDKQNQLSELLVRNQNKFSLPNKTIEMFDGSMMKFKSFMINFERLIEQTCDNDTDRLMYLQQYTTGRPHKLVSSCIYFDASTGYHRAKDLLMKEYNDDFKVLYAFLEKLENWPIIKNDDSSSLEELALFLIEFQHLIENSSNPNQMQNPKDVMSIVKKLPFKMRERWRRKSYDLMENYGRFTFTNLVNFVKYECEILKQPMYNPIQERVKPESFNIKKKALTTKSNDVTLETSKICIYCKKNNHAIVSCKFFEKLKQSEKSQFVRKSGLCYGCLLPGHTSKTCRGKLKCNTCSLLHPTVLHDPDRSIIDRAKPNFENRRQFAENNETKLCASNISNVQQKVIVPVLPVRLTVQSTNREIVINCALDSCSSDCWINEKLLGDLGIKLQNDTLINVSTMEGKNITKTRVLNNVKLSDLNGNNTVNIPVVYTKPNSMWPFTKDDLIKNSELNNFEHLRDLPISLLDSDIGMLIGMNIPSILKPYEMVEGSDNEPFATKHTLGWAVSGPVDTISRKSLCHRTMISKDEINSEIQTLFSRDFYDDSTECSFSVSDKKWLNKVNSSVEKIDNHFVINLPVKDNAFFPNNRNQIYNQFLTLKRKLDGKKDFAKEYFDFMQAMLDNEFTEKIPKNEIENSAGKIWYVPHHGVYHKQKHKLRVVFNCSMRYRGISLNDNLEQGPDLTNNLFGVLLRFREYRVAMVGDIVKMFYQVKIPNIDSNLLRYFWFDNNNEVCEYRLKVHVFGATSSPSVANFALGLTAKVDNCNEQIGSCIRNNFYVDDLLISAPSVEKTIELTLGVKDAILMGGFVLSSYNSNAKEVLDVLRPDCTLPPSNKVILNDSTADSRVLGITWNTMNDTFGYNITINYNENITKRDLLKTVASIYDPVGFVSPVIIPARKLFQECCKLKVDWDDFLPVELQSEWRRWVTEIESLNSFVIPRCLIKEEDVTNLEMHIYCDGSETAYGAVAYLRYCFDGEFVISFLASRSRLTPINNSTLKTIPRIELSSAKLAVELYAQLTRELSVKIGDAIFYSDSTTVLNYIKNENLRFQRFVDNKVSFIRNFTKPEQWFYVSTNDNPADLISRGTTPSKLKISKLWKKGPEYLSTNETPSLYYNSNISEEDIEVKTTKTLATEVREDSPLMRLINSSSSWYKSKVRVAWFLKLKHALRTKTRLPQELKVSDLKNAELEIIKYLQSIYYSREIESLSRTNNYPNNSSLRKFHPFIDSTGVLRVGGRIGRSEVPMSMKHPIIFPSCPASRCLMRETHNQVGHLGREMMLSTLRRRFWIIKANTMARSIVSQCISCKRYQGKVTESLMADLPNIRIRGDTPAFTNVGIDYFGPFHVTNGRKYEKRYGVVFSCLTSRAIHLELANCLSTDSFINALRRFISRRGNVESIVSDNGTNLVAGCTELKNSVREWNSSVVVEWLKQRDISWKFNPPYASHFGGVYEREIRTVRKVLTSITNEQNLKLNDEQLYTLLCEVESILNNRPLFEISSDPSDSEALTPNHLLLLNAGVTFPPGLFDKEDSYVKRRWRQIQYLTDLFWRRWTKEYLVLQQKRQKWFIEKEPLKVNDLVLVVDITLPRNQYPLGRITEVFQDDGGHVRSAKVKISKCKNNLLKGFKTTEIDRSVNKLIKLQCEEI